MILSQEKISKIKSYVGFSTRAGKTVIGTDRILTDKKIKLVLIDNKLAINAIKKIDNHCKSIKCAIYIIDNLYEISAINGCKALAITDKNLAEAIISCIN